MGIVAETWRGRRYLLPPQELCSQVRVARFGELADCHELARLGHLDFATNQSKAGLAGVAVRIDT